MNSKEELLKNLDLIHEPISARYGLNDGWLLFSESKMLFMVSNSDRWSILKEWNRNEVTNSTVDSNLGDSTLAFQGANGFEMINKISSSIDLESILQNSKSTYDNLGTETLPMMAFLPEDVAALTDVGLVRSLNEDNWSWMNLSDTIQLFAVADGMGGHDRGEVASEKAVTILCQEADSQLQGRTDVSLDDLQEILVSSFQSANNGIQEYAVQQGSDMGTTLVACLLYQEKMALIANVGDSRGYLHRGGELHLLTKDHSWVQRMVDQNQLTQEEARHHPHSNILMRTVGTERNVRIDVFPIEMQSGDILLLCSDGLWGEVEDVDMRDILNAFTDLEQCAKALSDLAKSNGGKDNITHVLVRIP